MYNNNTYVHAYAVTTGATLKSNKIKASANLQPVVGVGTFRHCVLKLQSRWCKTPA